MVEAKRIWFVSDVHITFGDRPYLDQFLTFLDASAKVCDELYIVGDLFEFWIGDRQAKIEFYAPLFDKFRELTAGGLKIKAVHGNRDFLMGKSFSRAGVEMLPEVIVLELAGKSVHVSHGDQFCIHDLSYQRARVVMRSYLPRKIAACLPAFVGVFLAKSYRRISERKKAKKKVKTGNRFHTIEDGLIAELEKQHFDVIVCGHIHNYAERELVVTGKACRVLTTGAWEEEGPNYVDFDGLELNLCRFG
ncbi:MAG: UDP-2,3-diacylglucosamine hydrolase [Planctomycetota bacterium]|jgi:UDP-2,3-diacylglucosamine hydrolase